MKRFFSLMLVPLMVAPVLQAAIREVPVDYATVQGAIDDANDGDVIIVSPGEYDENIDFSGKDITLTSLDPNDPNIVANTILTRHTRTVSSAGSIVSFTNGESRAAVLTGFTIKGGFGTNLNRTTFYGGGVLCMNASPTIVKNVITENRSQMGIRDSGPQAWGGGMYFLDAGAFVAYNTVHNNAAGWGGGVAAITGDETIFFSNLFFENEGTNGGGVTVFGATFLNNTFVENSATNLGTHIYAARGGIFGQTRIHNNIVCFGTRASGVYFEQDENSDWFAHNLVFGNVPADYAFATKTGQYGNLSADPILVNRSENDYRLGIGSPGIDAGTPDFDFEIGALDFAGEIRVRGAAVDIGAFESTLCTLAMANAGPDVEVSVGDLVVLDGSGSLFCDPNTPRLFLWDQTGGPAVLLTDPRSATPTFIADTEGEYRFELVVFDGAQLSRRDEVVVTVKAPTAKTAMDVAFVNVNVVTMASEDILYGQTVLIKDRRIARIAPAEMVAYAEDTLEIDASGQFLMPGLADMHVHFAHENDFILFLANGVTTVRELFGGPWKLSVRERVRNGEILGPQIFMASPLNDGNPPLYSGANVVTSEAQAWQRVEEYKNAGYEMVKVYSLLTPNVFNALVEASAHYGLLSVGHIPFSVGLEGAMSAKLNCSEHLYTYADWIESPNSDIRGQWSWRRLYGGFDIDESRLRALGESVWESGMWTSPTLVAIDRVMSPEEGRLFLDNLPTLHYVHPSVLSAWDPSSNDHTTVGFLRGSTPELREQGRDNRKKIVKALSDAGAGLLLGTDSNWVYVEPGFSIHAELQNFVEAGLSPYQAIKAGTRDAALFFDKLADFGTVSEGKRADLLLLEQNPLIDAGHIEKRVGVMVNGVWYQEAELQSMLNRVAEAYYGSSL